MYFSMCIVIVSVQMQDGDWSCILRLRAFWIIEISIRCCLLIGSYVGITTRVGL